MKWVSIWSLLLAGRGYSLIIWGFIVILRNLLIEELHLHQLVVMTLGRIISLPSIWRWARGHMDHSANPTLALTCRTRRDYVATFNNHLLSLIFITFYLWFILIFTLRWDQTRATLAPTGFTVIIITYASYSVIVSLHFSDLHIQILDLFQSLLYLDLHFLLLLLMPCVHGL